LGGYTMRTKFCFHPYRVKLRCSSVTVLLWWWRGFIDSGHWFGHVNMPKKSVIFFEPTMSRKVEVSNYLLYCNFFCLFSEAGQQYFKYPTNFVISFYFLFNFFLNQLTKPHQFLYPGCWPSLI
jgi:hypothetical protein